MGKKISRRHFIGGAAGLGAAASLGLWRPESAQATPGLYRWATGSNPRAFDPARAITAGDSLARSWANGLLRFKPGSGDPNEAQPDLAEKWESSNGHKTYTFHLRKGVQIHKGKGELTSEDVKWSYDRLKDKRLGSVFRGRFSDVDNIETPDRYTVRVHLKKPDGLFLTKVMNFRGGYIVAKAGAKDDVGTGMRWDPLGTGPFMISSFKPKEMIVLNRHDKYFRGTPHIKRYEYHIIRSVTTRILGLKKGELDAIYLATLPKRLLEQVKADPNVIVDVPDSAHNTCLYFNLKMKPMDDIRVRQAISYAINRDDVVKLFYPMAKPLYSPVAPICVGGLQPDEIPEALKYTYDPDKAKRLLKESGHGSGLRLETIVSASLPHVLRPAQVIQQQLGEVGIKLDVKTSDLPGYLKGARKDIYPVVLYGGKRFPHAYDYLHEWFHSDSIVGKPTRISNFSHYGDLVGNIDKLINEIGEITDQKRQIELAKKAQLQILKDLPCYPVFTPLVGFARRKTVDFGFKFNDPTIYVYELDERSRVTG